tara:strand:- start:5236 stop:5805 length:570 start_codon:yes stop_codon:yes gene_type:complete
MSEQDNTDTGSGAKVPVILLVHRAKHDLIEQTYKPLFIVECKEDVSAPFFFNSAQKEYIEQKAIVGFLSEYDYLWSEDSVQKAVDTISNNKYFGAVYSDIVLMARSPVPQVMPAFSRDTYNNLPINVPMFSYSQMLKQWDTDLKTTYFFDMFKKLGDRTLLAHVPEPLFSSKYHMIETEELKTVREKYA